MAWSPYQITFRLLSPLHIGWKKAGNLQQTRPYVTGRTLWGALTARLVRDQGDTNYHKIGKIVDDELRFTYFYPTTSQERVKVWPWDTSDKFSWQFLNSYASTALSSKTAEEGTLHETECISPKTRKGDEVYLTGYIIEKNGCELGWKEALKRIQIGGERGSGWGRIELIGEPRKAETCFGYGLNNTGGIPQITIPRDNPILAHTIAGDFECLGAIEPLVGRETTGNKGFGDKVSNAAICWIPGSKVEEEKKFEILPRGIWKVPIS